MKDIRNVSLEGRLANNLIFIFADMIQTLSMVSEREAEKAGFRFDNHTKMQLTKIKYAATDLRKRTVETSEQSQLTFGEDADKLLELMLKSIDRTGNDDRVMDLVLKYVGAYESKLNLRLNMFGV